MMNTHSLTPAHSRVGLGTTTMNQCGKKNVRPEERVSEVAFSFKNCLASHCAKRPTDRDPAMLLAQPPTHQE